MTLKLLRGQGHWGFFFLFGDSHRQIRSSIIQKYYFYQCVGMPTDRQLSRQKDRNGQNLIYISAVDDSTYFFKIKLCFRTGYDNLLKISLSLAGADRAVFILLLWVESEVPGENPPWWWPHAISGVNAGGLNPGLQWWEARVLTSGQAGQLFVTMKDKQISIDILTLHLRIVFVL